MKPSRCVVLLAGVVMAGCGKGGAVEKADGRDAVAVTTAAKPQQGMRRFPSYVTSYDIMTPEDEFYFHHLDNLCLGADLADWPLVKSLIGLGQNLVDANMLAAVANETIDTSGQQATARIVAVVNECARLLGVEPPMVVIGPIDGSNEPNACVKGLGEPHVLHLTGGLLDLFDETSEELRFIIGHELGHIKAKHLKTHFLAEELGKALSGPRGQKASFEQHFVAALTVGTLLHWFRESEYSADRAGLICVGGDVRVAQQALLRLVHRTKPSNKLLDPSHPDFDAELVLKNQMRLREEPFVKIVMRFRESWQSHPFIPERCAALQAWARSAEYQTMLERPKTAPADQSLVITSIVVKKIPRVDTYVPLVDSGEADPFAKVTCAGATRETAHSRDLSDADWSDLELSYDFREGAGIILELYDYNSALSNKLIGACLLPVPRGQAKGTVRADLRLDMLEPSTIVDRPAVTIEYRIESKK